METASDGAEIVRLGKEHAELRPSPSSPAAWPAPGRNATIWSG